MSDPLEQKGNLVGPNHELFVGETGEVLPMNPAFPEGEFRPSRLFQFHVFPGFGIYPPQDQQQRSRIKPKLPFKPTPRFNPYGPFGKVGYKPDNTNEPFHPQPDRPT